MSRLGDSALGLGTDAAPPHACEPERYLTFPRLCFLGWELGSHREDNRAHFNNNKKRLCFESLKGSEVSQLLLPKVTGSAYINISAVRCP